MPLRNTANPAYSAGTVHESKNFGKFKIVEYNKSTDVIVMFLDTCYVKKTTVKSISKGSVKDVMMPSICGVAFIGDGEFLSKYSGKDTKSYSVWRGMIKRCYDEGNKAYKYYGGRGVVVHDDWLNYQNFASWYSDNYPLDGLSYEIDKDDLGGDIYSEKTCRLVTHKDNMAIVSRNSKR